MVNDAFEAQFSFLGYKRIGKTWWIVINPFWNAFQTSDRTWEGFVAHTLYIKTCIIFVCSVALYRFTKSAVVIFPTGCKNKRRLGLVFVTPLPQHLPDEVLGLINNLSCIKLVMQMLSLSLNGRLVVSISACESDYLIQRRVRPLFALPAYQDPCLWL